MKNHYRLLILALPFILLPLCFNAQNVGINVEDPEELLHLNNGNIRLDRESLILFNSLSGDTSGLRYFSSGTNFGSTLFSGSGQKINTSSHDTLSGLVYDFTDDRVFIGRDYPINSLEKFGITTYPPLSGFGGMFVEAAGPTGIRPFYGYAVDSTWRADHYFDAPSSSWRLRVGGVRMTVDSTTGNVGIGILNPQNRLHVLNTMRVEDPSTPAINLYKGATQAGYINWNNFVLSLSNTTSGSIEFKTSDIARMSILPTGDVSIDGSTFYLDESSGNVGIGYSVPGDKLHVQGDIRINNGAVSALKLYNNSTFNSYLQQNGSNLFLANRATSGGLFFRTEDISRMFISSSGQVGIGTISPTTTLDVAGGIRADSLDIDGIVAFDTLAIGLVPGNSPMERTHIRGKVLLENIGATIPTVALMSSGNITGSLSANASHVFLHNTGTGDVRFLTDGTTRMIISNNGFTGIGQNSPLENLHVQGNARIENTSPILKLYRGGIHSAELYQSSINTNLMNKENGNLYLGTNNNIRFTVDNIGNIGIGTINPVSKLQVAGNVRLDANDPILLFADQSVVGGQIRLFSTTFTVENPLPTGIINLRTNGAERMRIDENGNIGIHKTTPAFPLHVNGIAAIEGSSGAEMRFLDGIQTVGVITADDPVFTLRNNRAAGEIHLQTLGGTSLKVQNSNEIRIDETTLYVDAADNKVGVNTANPTARLTVNGDFRVDGATFWVDNIDNQVVIGGGTGATGYALSVNGKIITEELKVQLYGSWPDYVFDDTYDLMSLGELDNFIKVNKHLPGVPAASDVERADGIELGEMNRILLEKIEELTLHVIAQQKEIDELKVKYVQPNGN